MGAHLEDLGFFGSELGLKVGITTGTVDMNPVTDTHNPLSNESHHITIPWGFCDKLARLFLATYFVHFTWSKGIS